jgi:ribosomal protein S6--L-glutamate ligase
MKIGLITTRKKGRTEGEGSVMGDVAARLESRGYTLEPIFPDETLLDISNSRPDCDLYLLKSGTTPAMALAAILDAADAQILNRYDAVVKIKSKILSSRLLSDAGIPVPDAFVANDTASLAPLLSRNPIVIKPLFGGSRGRGVEIVHSIDELPQSDDGAFFVQSYHQPDGKDYKLYRIASKVFGVRRVWPARTLEEKLGEPFDPSQEMIDITMRCGEAFGINLYGIDIITSGGRPYVVDINSFPGFKGIPEAGRYLADYITEYLEKL